MRKIFILHSCTNHYIRIKPRKESVLFWLLTPITEYPAHQQTLIILKERNRRGRWVGKGEEVESRRVGMGELCAAVS